jgi:hypothetical protein
MGEIHINKGRVGEERGGKETDGCPLTDGSSARPKRSDQYSLRYLIDFKTS